MTESTAPAASTKPASFWEDLIDIFYQPSDVYRRRERASAWPPYLFAVIAVAIITMAIYPAIQPAFDGDYSRNIPRIMAANPQMTQAMADKGSQYQGIAVRYFAGAVTAGSLLITGVLVWLVGKLFGAIEGFPAAMLIVSYAYVPRVIASVLSGLQGLLMDPVSLTSAAQLTLSPARFLDPATASPILVAALSRLDVSVIWETVLIGIGIAVIGKISRGKATGFAVLIWVLGSLYQLRAAFLIS